MKQLMIFIFLLLCAGCVTTEKKGGVGPVSSVEEISVKIEPSNAYANDERIEVLLFHDQAVKESSDEFAEGKKRQFSIPVASGVWVRVKRSNDDVGYEALTECLLDGEMVPVSSMPGDNFSVKIEELALEKYRVMGIFLCSPPSGPGGSGKTVPFDFVANLGDETTVFRETVTY